MGLFFITFINYMNNLKIIINKALNYDNMEIAGKFTLILSPLVTLIAPVKHLFIPLLILVCVDVFTGILKNRVYKKQPVSSSKFIERKPIIFLLWSTGLLVMLICDIFLKEIGITGNWAAKLYCVFYGIYESISILENLGEMRLPGAYSILRLLKGRLPSNMRDEFTKEKKDGK